MKTTTLATLMTALATTAAGCNEHPLKGVEYEHYGDGGEAGGGEEGGESAGESGESGEEGGGTPECGGEVIDIDDEAANVMLVLDKSGSMTSNTWDHDGDGATGEVTRWWSLFGVVENIVAAHDGDVNFGAVLFPAQGASGGNFQSACLMEDEAEIPVAPNNGAAILAGIPGRNDDTSGGTPAREGILNALDHLVSLGDDAPKAMVLVTDGAANCVPGADPFHSQYDEELALAVGSAYRDNDIPTYVVGINILDEVNAGKNTRVAINEVAEAGGVTRAGDDGFYNVFDQVALQGALDAIAARVECTVALTDAPSPQRISVTVGGEPAARVDSCDDGDGWRAAAGDGSASTIELCGATCDAFRAQGQLETDYACIPVG